MKTKDILKNMKNYLENDNFEEIDNLLQEIYSSELSSEQDKILGDILQEITLYSELKEEEYKTEALKLISEI